METIRELCDLRRHCLNAYNLRMEDFTSEWWKKESYQFLAALALSDALKASWRVNAAPRQPHLHSEMCCQILMPFPHLPLPRLAYDLCFRDQKSITYVLVPYTMLLTTR